MREQTGHANMSICGCVRSYPQQASPCKSGRTRISIFGPPHDYLKFGCLLILLWNLTNLRLESPLELSSCSSKTEVFTNKCLFIKRVTSCIRYTFRTEGNNYLCETVSSSGLGKVSLALTTCGADRTRLLGSVDQGKDNDRKWERTAGPYGKRSYGAKDDPRLWRGSRRGELQSKNSCHSYIIISINSCILSQS